MQYKPSWKNRTIQDKNFQNTVNKLRNTGQKSRQKSMLEK